MKFDELYNLVESEEKTYKYISDINVNLGNCTRLKEIPKIFKDSIIKHSFFIPKSVTSLKNSPFQVGDFSTWRDSKVKSLLGGPKIATRNYNASKMKLDCLDGLPMFVGWSLDLPVKSNIEKYKNYEYEDIVKEVLKVCNVYRTIRFLKEIRLGVLHIEYEHRMNEENFI